MVISFPSPTQFFSNCGQKILSLIFFLSFNTRREKTQDTFNIQQYLISSHINTINNINYQSKYLLHMIIDNIILQSVIYFIAEPFQYPIICIIHIIKKYFEILQSENIVHFEK